MSDIHAISALRLEDGTNGVVNALHRGDTLAAMRNVDSTLTALRDITVSLIEVGVREGLTQAEMSRALGVPSYLRGAKQEFAR